MTTVYVYKTDYEFRTDMINERRDKPCNECGGRFPVICMEFHHRDPKTKLFNVGSKGRGKNYDELRAEMDKCDVVCSNCHKLLTADDVRAKKNAAMAPFIDECGDYIFPEYKS